MPRKPALAVRKRIFFGLLVAALTLVACEGALRLIFGPPPPPVRVFGALGEHETMFTVSESGINKNYIPTGRSSDPLFPARWDGPRVAVLGESSVHLGSGIPASSEFPGLLESKLGFPVVNLGAPALDSFDLVKIAEDVVDWDFSALVVYCGHNDLGNAYFQERYGTVSAGLAAHAQSQLGHLQLFAQLKRVFGPIDGIERTTHQKAGYPNTRLTPERLEVTRIYFEKNLRRIAWLAHQHGMAVVLVTPVSRLLVEPLANSCNDEVCARDLFNQAQQVMGQDPTTAEALLEQARDLDGQPQRANTAMTETMRVAARAEHTWLVDARFELPQEPNIGVPAAWLFNDILHFSAAGHQAMANMLEAPVREAVEAAEKKKKR